MPRVPASMFAVGNGGGGQSSDFSALPSRGPADVGITGSAASIFRCAGRLLASPYGPRQSP